MTPDEARRYVEVPDLYVGEIEALVGETRADKPGLTSALNPHLHGMARGVAIVREKITADAENMTRMIAGMRAEYAVRLPDGRPVGAGWGTYATALEDMSAWRRGGYDARVVRRYTTEPEEA